MELFIKWGVVAVLFTSFGAYIAKGNPACNYPKEILGVQLESWSNVSDWKSLNPNAPTVKQSIVQTLDLPRTQGLNNIGLRMRAYFLAPLNGTYKFYITCDDDCELKLSTDEKLENLETLVVSRLSQGHLDGSTGYKAWTKKRSSEVYLRKDRSYLLEVLMVQFTGVYHMTVAVILPNGVFDSPVSNKYLVKYAPPGSYGKAPVGDWGEWSQCSKTCGEGTQTRYRGCLYPPPVYQPHNTTNMREMRVCFTKKPCRILPCSAPAWLAADNHTSPFGIKVAWKALPNSCWQGVPRGYSIRLEVQESAHDRVGNKTWRSKFSVCSNSTEALLEGLNTSTTYIVRIAALTENGRGPYSEALIVETCRCHNKILVNWMHAPPLCVKSDGQTPTGIIPDLLNDIIPRVCGTCHGYQPTEIIFRERSSEHNMIGSLTEHHQLNIPISLKPEMPHEGEGWVFLPLVEVSGFAFLARKPSVDAYARFLASSVMVRWPAFVMMFMMYFMFGLAVWTVEKYKNPTHFPPCFTRGWTEGVWWAFVSMTTVGYGDRCPKSVPGKLLGIACFLVGVIMNALFVATLASSLTVFVFDLAANPDRGKKIGVISGTVEQHLGMRIIGGKGITYNTSDGLLEGLKTGALDGTLKDVFTVNSLIKDLNDSDFVIPKTVSKPFHYGIGLTGETRYLLKDLKKYLSQRTVTDILDSSSTEAAPTVPEKEEEQEVAFFDPTNFIYRGTVKVTGIALVVLATSGVIFHVISMQMKKKKGQLNIKDPPLTPSAIKEEMRQLLEEFHIRMQRTYCALKIKHRRELLKIREKRTIPLLVAQIHSRKYTSEENV